jgi:osmotically-inducible protein OsmY
LLGLIRPFGREGPLDGDEPRHRRARPLTGLLQDEQLARTVRERLVARRLTNPHVDVTIVDGIAYLRGRPRDASDVPAIIETIQTTPGLTGVVNELKLPEPAAAPPAD